MTLRPVRTSPQTWLGWCAVVGLLASCSSSGGVNGTGGTSGGSGSGGLATGGKAGTGGSAGAAAGASGGSAGGSANGGSGGGTAGGGSGGGQVVGTSGGSVTQAGVTLSIPTSALSASTAITVATTTAPSGYTLASAAYQFGPSGTIFTQPVAVTIPLTSATPGVHLFWSNASGGFDDVGGTVTGSSITANVTHFSIGFCAVPKAGGTGGSSASGGASGASGGGGQAGAGAAGGVSGVAGSGAGAGGSSSSGAGGSGSGSGGTGAGTGGGAGTTGAGGSAGASGATDAGLGADAAASLCKTFGLNLPSASVSNVDAGIAPDSSAYTGGTIASGRYFLNSVTHYGAGSYPGSKQAQYTFDATAKTIVIGEFVPLVGGSQYVGMTYTEVNANTLRATVVCNSGTTPTGTFDMYYTVNGAQITLTAVGSSDVSVL